MGEWLPTHVWQPQGATFLMARGTPSMFTTGHISQPSPPPARGISSALKSLSFTCESKMLTTPTEERLQVNMHARAKREEKREAKGEERQATANSIRREGPGDRSINNQPSLSSPNTETGT